MKLNTPKVFFQRFVPNLAIPIPPMGWMPDEKLNKDGMHYHLPEELRVEIYSTLKGFIESA